MSNILAVMDIVVCSAAVLLSIFILVKRQEISQTSRSVIPICLFGLGWCTFLFAAITNTEMPRLSITLACLTIVFSIVAWLYFNYIYKE